MVTDFLFFFSCPELSNYRIFVFTRSITDSHGFSVTNYRISITRNIADSHGFFFFLSRIREFSNFIFLVPRLVLCPELSRLVLGPTDQREVIIEFLSSHGISRTVTDFLFSFLVPNYRIIEFYLSCPETCPLSRDLSFVPNYRIFEFLSSVTFRDSPCD